MRSGTYIPKENFAVRLENTVLITKDGPVDLMPDIPIEAEEIEQLMREHSAADTGKNGNGKAAKARPAAQLAQE